jgi:hypothetical protein
VLTITRRNRSRKRKSEDGGWRAKKEGKPKHSDAKVHAYQRKWAGRKEESREQAMQVPGRTPYQERDTRSDREANR